MLTDNKIRLKTYCKNVNAYFCPQKKSFCTEISWQRTSNSFPLGITIITFILYSLKCFAQTTAPDTSIKKQPVKQAITGFIDVNGYYDTRQNTDFTLNMMANLPHRFQYFTFTNYYSSSKVNNMNTYYSEHHLYWAVNNKLPFDLSTQWMTLSGSKNDAFRFGFRWRANNTPGLENFCKKIGLIYRVAFQIYEIHNDTKRTPWLAQIEHFYRLSLFKNRLYISGFADQDINYKGGKPFTFVTEHQIGLRIAGGLHAVAEYRINEYKSSQQTGWGLGIEYFMKF